MKVKLETSEGNFVHEGVLPPFNPAPEVVFWGIRVFKQHAIEKRPDGYTIYREVFAVALVDMPAVQA